MSSRYNNIAIDTLESGERYYRNAFYPDIEPDEDDIYVIATDGDRFDKLSEQFYYTSEYWWIIVAANNIAYAGSLAIEPGTQIRIPASPSRYLDTYRNINTP